MGVGGCTTCHPGAFEALNALTQDFLGRHDAAKASVDGQPSSGTQNTLENRPIQGALPSIAFSDRQNWFISSDLRLARPR